MKLSSIFGASALVLGSLQGALSAPSFAANNLYYAAGLTDEQSTFLLEGLKSAGVKVLRVWLDGEFLIRIYLP